MMMTYQDLFLLICLKTLDLKENMTLQTTKQLIHQSKFPLRMIAHSHPLIFVIFQQLRIGDKDTEV